MIHVIDILPVQLNTYIFPFVFSFVPSFFKVFFYIYINKGIKEYIYKEYSNIYSNHPLLYIFLGPTFSEYTSTVLFVFLSDGNVSSIRIVDSLYLLKLVIVKMDVTETPRFRLVTRT